MRETETDPAPFAESVEMYSISGKCLLNSVSLFPRAKGERETGTEPESEGWSDWPKRLE